MTDRDKVRDSYIVICGQIIGGPGLAFETVYGFDGERFGTREKAVAHGFTLDRADDFNIGVVRGGVLVSLDWMDKAVNTEPSLLAAISKQIGL